MTTSADTRGRGSIVTLTCPICRREFVSMRYAVAREMLTLHASLCRKQDQDAKPVGGVA